MGITWHLNHPLRLNTSLARHIHTQASGRLSVSRYLPWPTRWADGHKYDLRFYCLLLSPTQVGGVL